jgi:acetyltransferase
VTGLEQQKTDHFNLRDGAAVAIRPIMPDDAPRLQSMFSRLSSESIYFRFLEYRKTVTDQQAYEFANIDYQTQMALVAALEENGEQHLIAVARYFVQACKPEHAEVGIVVEDRFQNQGLGTFLLNQLTLYAVDRGIQAFVATVSHQNSRILRFIKKSGLPSHKMLDMGMWDVEVRLEK